MEKHERTLLHHETICQLVYADKRSGGDLYQHLRIISKPYLKRYRSSDGRGRIKNRVSIDEKPDVVERRNHIGDCGRFQDRLKFIFTPPDFLSFCMF